MKLANLRFRTDRWLAAPLAACFLFLAGCDSSSEGPASASAVAGSANAPAAEMPPPAVAGGPPPVVVPTPGEVAVPEPDFTTAEPAVQELLRQRRVAFDQSLLTNTAPVPRAEAWGQLGVFYFAYQFPGTAAACFTNSVFLTPADHRAWYGLAECRLEDDDYEGAIVAMETALRRMEGVASATFADQNSARQFLGDALERLGRIPEALLQFETVLVLDKNDLYAQAKAGQLKALTGNGPDAIEYLESAHRRAPKNQTLRSLLAQEYRRAGRTNQAAALIADLNQGAAQAAPLVRPDPWRRFAADLVESPTMLVRRANRFAKAGRPRKAIAAYEAALRLDPTNNTAAINLASALLSVRRPAEARRIIEEVAARGDASEELRYNLALARVATGATNEALAVTELWRRERPDEPMTLRLEGQVRQRIGDLAGAQTAFGEYLRLKPGTIPVALQLARLQARSGKFAEARQTLEDGLQLTPNHPALSFELARLLALNPLGGVRDPVRAVELLTPLMTRKPALPQIETMILALHASGDRSAATERFKRLTNSVAIRTNAVLATRMERLGAVLASSRPVEEPWPFALNARGSTPEETNADEFPAKTP